MELLLTLASDAAAVSPASASLFSPENLVALLTLTALEIVLGVDNIIVIAIVTGRLPKEQQPKARFVGLALAMGMRILLLLAISWVMRLKGTLFAFTVPWVNYAVDLSGKDLILIGGGLFLIWKSTKEIHHDMEGPHDHGTAKVAASFASAIGQILLMDLIFSLDSVITAVGMARDVRVMVIAVVIAVLVMMVFAGKISDFVHRHPSVKILALAFLILVGVLLVADGLDTHVSRGYVYFAMAFSLVVELVNIRIRAKQIALQKAAGVTPAR